MTIARTIVVPAHNEATVIGRCLRALLGDADEGEFSVVVVSNGSTDGTGDAARAAAPGAQVLELDVASKPAALRAGLDASSPGPVAVVDADVEMPTRTVRALFDALDAEEAAVAAARPEFDTARSSWPVRRYYRVWTSLPYAKGSTVGSGAFALNQAARLVLGTVPDVVNDDAWVRRMLSTAHRHAVDEPFVVHPARTARALVARRARVVDGNRQLSATLGPDSDGTGVAALRAGFAARDFGPVDAGTFLVLTMAARIAAVWRRRSGSTAWATDTTSREAA